MPPSAIPSQTPRQTPAITPKECFSDLLLYALPRFSDVLRRLTDIKSGDESVPALKMSPGVALWLTLALIGVIISANSYSVGFQEWQPDAQGQITTLIPLGREDVIFRPMALVPPVLAWTSHVVNFCSRAVGWLIPDIPLMGGSPEWHPKTRLTVWSDATLALGWWFGGFVSVLVSSTQGLFTRTVPLSKQREYASRLNQINKIDLNPKAIAPAKRAVRQANNWGQSAVFLMCLLAVAGWGWELFVADGALTGSAFGSTTRWIYGIASAFMAELCWFVAEHTGKKL